MIKEFIDSFKDQNYQHLLFNKDQHYQYSLFTKNLNTNYSYVYNEKVPIPSASMIKLFIMGEAFRVINEGKVHISDKIKFADEYFYNNDPQLFSPGNSYTMNEFITGMINSSHNGATNMLIDILGMDKINDFIESINMRNTVLNRKMLDFESAKNGKDNITTAYDLEHFLEKLYYGQIVNEEYSQMMIEIMKSQNNNLKMKKHLPQDAVVANKTGELEGIEHDAGIVFTSLVDYIFVMLTWKGENKEFLQDEIGRKSKKTFDDFVTYHTKTKYDIF